MKGKVRMKIITIFLMVAGACGDFLDELKVSLDKLQDTVDKISLEQIKTNKKVDQLEEKISLGQIQTYKKVDNLEEKIEELGTKVNKNISDAFDQFEEKISLEQIKTNKKVDQLEEKISLGQIETNKRVDNMEEKIEKLGSKVITVEDLNEVNNNISDAIDQLKDEMKTSLEKFSEYGCNEVETDVPNIANGNKDGTILTEDHIDALNHVKEVEEKGKNIICLPT